MAHEIEDDSLSYICEDFSPHQARYTSPQGCTVVAWSLPRAPDFGLHPENNTLGSK